MTASIIGRTCYARDPEVPSRHGWGRVVEVREVDGRTVLQVELEGKGTYSFYREHVRVNQPRKQKILRRNPTVRPCDNPRKRM